MVHEVRDRTTLHTLLTSADALVVGPGLGQDGWAELLLREALTQRKPTVLDADALNLLARHPDWLPEPRDHLVLTPHPGEAARLLGTDTDTIQGDRPAAARALQQRWGGSIVLKGAGSLVCHPDQALMLCPYGNPGMASAGMGDVLSGIVGGLLAQSLQPRYAVNLAVTLHSAAADILAASAGERGLLAGDLIPVARRLLNGLDS
jgi:NAD(P)H-hydrate epimerase